MTTWGKHVDDYMPENGTPKSLCAPLLEQALAALGAYEVNGQQFHLIEHRQLLQLYLDCLGANGNPGGGNPCAEECERDCEDLNETLVDFKINGWRVFQNIRNQFFENHYVFHADISGAVRNSLGQINAHTPKMVTPALRRRDLLDCDPRPCQGRWVRVNFSVLGVDWNRSHFADPYYVDWAEVDNGTVTVNAGASRAFKFIFDLAGIRTEITETLNLGISRTGAAIVPLGEQSVDYCTPIRSPINTTSVTFRCN